MCHVLSTSYQQTVAPSTAVQANPNAFVCKMQHNLGGQRQTQQQETLFSNVLSKQLLLLCTAHRRSSQHAQPLPGLGCSTVPGQASHNLECVACPLPLPYTPLACLLASAWHHPPSILRPLIDTRLHPSHRNMAMPIPPCFPHAANSIAAPSHQPPHPDLLTRPPASRQLRRLALPQIAPTSALPICSPVVSVISAPLRVSAPLYAATSFPPTATAFHPSFCTPVYSPAVSVACLPSATVSRTTSPFSTTPAVKSMQYRGKGAHQHRVACVMQQTW